MKRNLQYMTKKMLPTVLGTLLLSIGGQFEVKAQSEYNYYSGRVWVDKIPEGSFTGNGLYDAGETLIEGIVVRLKYSTTGATISSGVTDANGSYTLKNYNSDKTKSMQIEFYFPDRGFNFGIIPSNGPINDRNTASVGDQNYIGITPLITLDAGGADMGQTKGGYNMALERKPFTRTYWVSQQDTVAGFDKTISLPKFYKIPSDNSGAVLTNVHFFYASYNFEESITLTNGAASTNAVATVGCKTNLVIPAIPSSGGNDDSLKGNASEVTVGSTLAANEVKIFTNLYSANAGFKVNLSPTTVNYRAYNDPLDIAYFTASAGDSSIDYPNQSRATFGGESSGGGQFEIGYVTRTGGGYFIVYQANAPLPLVLTEFQAYEDNGNGLLKWSATSDGTPNEYFVVEHSTDGRNFKAIGEVLAKWDLRGVQKYEFRHLRPTSGKNFYRIVMNESIGKPEYSSVSMLNFGTAAKGLTVYPVPADGELYVEGAKDAINVRLSNMTGQQMEISKQMNGERLNIQTKGLPNGIYLLQVSHKDGSVDLHRITIQHL